MSEVTATGMRNNAFRGVRVRVCYILNAHFTGKTVQDTAWADTLLRSLLGFPTTSNGDK